MDEQALIESLADAIRKVPYLTVAERLRGERRKFPDGKEIYAEWCRQQARVVIDVLREKGLLEK